MLLACLTAMSVAILAALPAAASAVTYSVDSAADNTTDNGSVTLREAILASNGAPANDDAPPGAANGDRIEFNLAGNTTIVLTDELPTITDDLVVDGSAVDGLIVSGDVGNNNLIGDNVRIFDVDTSGNEAVAITGLVVTEGNTANSSGDNGGGIRIASGENVTLSGMTVSQSFAARRGGGIFAGNGTLTISGSTIGGSAPGLGNAANGAGADDGGGGLYVLGGSAILTATTVRNNDALNAAGSGGGLLLNGGALNVTGSTVSDNDSSRAGGGIEVRSTTGAATAVITDSFLDANKSGNSPGNGGGLHVTAPSGANPSTVDVSRSVLVDNTANAEGGGLWNDVLGTLSVTDSLVDSNTASGAGADQGGGGIFNNGGAVTLVNATVSGNMANGVAGSGGGYLNDGGTLTMSDGSLTGNTSVRAGGGFEATAQNRASTATFSDVDVIANSTGNSPGNGGGLHVTDTVAVATASSLTINGGAVLGNTANQEGGGLWNDGGGTMNIAGARIMGNTALSANAGADAQGGGGIFNNGGGVTLTNATVEDNGATGPLGNDDGGGGLFNDGRINPGTVTVVNSTLTGNHALSGVGRGGGALNLGDGDTTATLLATNVTAAGNSARAGGGLANLTNGVATLTHSTLSGNSASDGGGVANLATATLRNSILAGSIGGDAASGSALGFSGVNVVGDGSAGCAAPACLAVDPLLDAAGPRSNGGPTETIALQAGSPAVDAAFQAICDEASPQGPGGTDQRGQPRPSGPACDIGAFELQQAALPSPPAPDTSVTIRIAGKRLRLDRRGVARVRLTCPRAERSPPCRGTLILRTRTRVRFRGKQRRVVLGKARFGIAAGRTAAVRLRIVGPKARLVRRNRRARRVLAIARVSDTAGNQRTVRKGMLIVPPGRRKS